MEAKFVCNLKKYRVAQELTQEQLADIVGVRRETIMRLEKAQYNPSLKWTIDICTDADGYLKICVYSIIKTV